MKTRFVLPTILMAVAAALASHASAATRIDCKTDASGQCEPPPPAPAPPAPPQPPAQPLAPAALAGPPPPPPIPAPPRVPPVPAAAHAACAAKAADSVLTWQLRKGETMSGVCEMQGGTVRFVLHRYHLED